MTRRKQTLRPPIPNIRYYRIDNNIDNGSHSTSRRRRFLKRRAARLARHTTRMTLRQQRLSQTGAMAA
jgi:hypothetical protein